jgi:cupin fold WbuC family metalloprotein
MKIFSVTDIHNVSNKASISPRRRAHHNFSLSAADIVQRFLNAIEPGSYVRPHRHPDSNRWEWFQAITGSASILTFDSNGRVLEKTTISSRGPFLGVEIPGEAWHTVTSLVQGTVLLELKPGPYDALTDKDFAQWAPPEGHDSCPAFEFWFREASVGDLPPFVVSKE